MYKKIYKRFPIKLWENECGDCCAECDYFDMCGYGCYKQEVTCNQCEYEEIWMLQTRSNVQSM